jgi:intracellular septation protein
VPDVAVLVGYAWAALMFASAALNAVVALNFSVAAWASFMSGYGILSKLCLFLIGYAAMRTIAGRRLRAMSIADRDALNASLQP